MTQAPVRIAKRIHALRRKSKLSQVDLAELCGVSKQAVSAWERGLALPSSRHLEVLALALRTSVGKLFGETP
jgi:transcriptional regulator with XRE-family HTH domain